MALDPSNGRLYVADRLAKTLNVFDSATGSALTVVSTWGGGSTFTYPCDVALDGQGHLFVADFGSGGNGAQVEEFTTGLSFVAAIGAGALVYPRGVWADSQGTTLSLYITSHFDGVYRYDSVSGGSFNAATTFGGSVLNVPTGIVKSGNRVYVVDDGSRVIGFDIPGYAPTTFYSSASDLKGIRTDPLGNFYVTEASNGILHQFLSGFVSPTVDCLLPNTPWGIALDGQGRIFVSQNGGASITVVQGCGASSTVTPTPPPTASGNGYLYPSPVRGGLAHFAYTLAQSGRLILRIWTQNGELAAEVTDSQSAGFHSTALDLSGFAPGVYFYTAILEYSGSAEKLKRGKFVVIH